MKKILFLVLIFNFINASQPQKGIAIKTERLCPPGGDIPDDLSRTMAKFGYGQKDQRQMVKCINRTNRFIENHKIISAIGLSAVGSAVACSLLFLSQYI